MAAFGTCTPITGGPGINTGSRSSRTRTPRSAQDRSAQLRSRKSRSAKSEPNDWDWVEAAPFRAHLIWLIEATGIDRHTIAELTGVPARLVGRLLGPRSRALRRLPPHFARQLLLLTPRSITAYQSNRVPAERVRRVLLVLSQRGCPDTESALLTGLDPTRVRRFRRGQIDRIDEYTEARVLGRARAAGLEGEVAEALTAAA